MVELEPLGRLHRHHVHAVRALPGVLLAQPRLGDGGDRAREVAAGGLRRAAHVGRGQLGEAREVLEALDDLGRGREQQLAAEAEPLDQAVHVEVGAGGVDRRGGRAVELEEVADAVARLRRDLRGLERGVEAGDHVELPAAGDLRHAREVDRAQLDRRAGERAHHGAGVAGVDQQAQPREQVADLGALEEGGGAGQPVRHRALLERDRDRLALAAHRPHEHAHVLGRDVLARDQPLDLGRHRLRLRALGGAAPERDVAAGLAFEGLLQPVGGGLDDGAGGAQDPLAGAERAREADDRGVRPLGAEVVHVLGRGAAEAMDRLVVVGGRGDGGFCSSCKQTEQKPLGEARVLQLVDEHVPVALGEPVPHVRAGAQQAEAVQHEVADVERAGVRQHSLVRAVQLGELALAGALLGEGVRPGGVVVGGHELVLEAVDPLDDRAERRTRVAAQVVVAQGQVVDPLEQHRQPVGGADRGGERVEARLERLVAQQARAEAVEGRDGELLVGAFQPVLEVGSQGVGRGGREAQHEQRLRRRAVAGEVQEALGQDGRLAGARTAQDQQRAAGVLDGGALLRAQRDHLRRIRPR